MKLEVIIMNFNYSENLNQLGQFSHEADFSISDELTPLVSESKGHSPQAANLSQGARALAVSAVAVSAIGASAIAMVAAPLIVPLTITGAAVGLHNGLSPIDYKRIFSLIMGTNQNANEGIKPGERHPI
jgi:hypothetical protein